jgi:large subunit ribosomal protein L6e
MAAAEGQTKKFGASERKIPHHSEKASKYYPAEDERQPKTVRSSPGHTGGPETQ